MTAAPPPAGTASRHQLHGAALHAPEHVLDLVEPYLGSDAPAVTDHEGGFTYRELDERSATIARVLLKAGVQPGDHVLIHARLSRWAVVAMLGVLRSGAAYVPVDAAFPAGRRQHIARASGARYAVVEKGLTGVPPTPVMIPADVREAGSGTVRGPLAYTCYTSGSTGTPKGVTISTRALAASTAARLQYYDAPVTRFVLCSSISFDSSVAGIYWTLASGGELVIPSDRQTDILAIARAAAGASHMLTLPSLYRMMLRGELFTNAVAPRTVIVAGESCPPDLLRQHFAAAPDSELFNEYGPTECTVWSTVHRCRQEDASAESVPIGRPIPGATLYVESAGDAPGELVVGGPGLAEQYRTAGEFRTGDLVSVDTEGRLLFHGRADDQLKLGGMRIERSEIISVLTNCPGVAEAAVGVAERNGRFAVLGVVTATDPSLTPGTVRAHALRHLPGVAVPGRIEVRSQLPTLPNGKVDQRGVDQLAAQASPPRTRGRR
ncbi:amino acid adenylation domain-containing protein [Micromonospora sp. ANENR4]|uniref:amino acid adenylation domain-containing protein n=1 Tax=Micromonospora sp. ANENR4 TaxID=2783662 RepID=UPI00188F5BAD|nr:amino acid adenylation domain-containing protein [Micromonospora sp. ANENR4]